MGYEPKPANAAVLYVASNGSDGAATDGKSWNSAFLTPQKALDNLPANGGIVDVGYGTFPGWALNNTKPVFAGVTIRGRGKGKHKSVTGAGSVPTGTHPTMFNTPCTAVATLTGGEPESSYIRVNLEDFAVQGVTGDGITVDSQEVYLNRVASEENTGNGLVFAGAGDDCFIEVANSHFVKNGASGVQGGILASMFRNVYFAGNTLDGYMDVLQSQEVVFLSCTSQYNGRYGYSLLNGGVFTWLGGHIENNAAMGVHPQANGGVYNLHGVGFYANGNWHIQFSGGTDCWNIMGCGGSGAAAGTGPSIYSGNGAGSALLANNRFADAYFLSHYNGATNIASARSNETFRFGTGANVVKPQTLAANGAVTIDASLGDIQAVTLAANATSATITNGLAGQTLIVDVIQDATGGRSFTPPPNCKFAGGAPPTWSATAGYRDSVTFRFDGTNWNEIARSIGVH